MLKVNIGDNPAGITKRKNNGQSSTLASYFFVLQNNCLSLYAKITKEQHIWKSWY